MLHSPPRRRAIVPLAITLASATLVSVLPALAGTADGVWMRSDGQAKVRFAPCGDGSCGTIVWLKTPGSSPAHVGEQVFFGMGESGPDHWKGRAHNPEDGNDYDGTMTLSGNRLTTQGCALGGMICKTATWTRSK